MYIWDSKIIPITFYRGKGAVYFETLFNILVK